MGDRLGSQPVAVSDNKRRHTGSTHQITPEQWVNDLKALGRAGIGGQPPNAPPGMPDSNKPPRSPGGGGRITHQQ